MAYDTSSPHFSAGTRLQSQGRFKEAVACFEAWLQKEPANVVAWNLKGLALRGLSKFDDAMYCFDQALKVLPNDAPTFGNMGRTLHDKGDYEVAILALDKNLATHPSSADVWSFKGSCFAKLQRPREALLCFEKATALEPKKAEYWSNKGASYADLGSFAEALECAQRAISVEPGCAAVWFNKAHFEEELDNTEAAIHSLETFVSLAPATMPAQITNARERIQQLKRSVRNETEQDSLDPKMQAILDVSERIANAPTEWLGDKVVTAEMTVRVPGLGLLGAVTLKGEITQEGSRYKCKTEVICLPMASKHEEKELFKTLDEAKQNVIKSWSAEAGALSLVLMCMPDE